MRNFLLLINILFAGCAVTHGERFALQQDMSGHAELHFFRTPGFMAAGLKPMLRVNGNDISGIARGGYVTVLLDPGVHVIELVDNKNDGATWSSRENIRFEVKLSNSDQKTYEYVVKSFWVLPIPVGVPGVILPVAGGRNSVLLEKTVSEVLDDLNSLKGTRIDLRRQ